MRYSCLLMALSILPVGGCAAIVAGRGKDLGKLNTREQVHAVFGTPTTTGENDGKSFEEFRSHCKLSERWKGEGLVMFDFMTLGLGEFITFPSELCRAARQRIIGQTLRFTYNEEGHVTEHLVNGKPFYTLLSPIPLPPRQPTSQESEQSPTAKIVTLPAALFVH